MGAEIRIRPRIVGADFLQLGVAPGALCVRRRTDIIEPKYGSICTAIQASSEIELIRLPVAAEVIAVNQDVLGRQARIVRKTEEEFILAKPLADGSVAVGLFNIGENQRTLAVTAGDLGLKRVRGVRDVWRQRELGRSLDNLQVQVPPHGVEMFRVR